MVDFILTGFWLALGSWVFITGWAFATARAVEIRGARKEFTWIVKIPLYIFLAGGAVANVVFNILVGSFIFSEFPKEWFFSDRVRRQLLATDSRKALRARGWRERINKIWPEHIK